MMTMPTRTILVLMLSLLVFSACAQDEPPPADDLFALITKAEQGDAEAQYKLGVRYDTGDGVPQDHEEAARWYRLAKVSHQSTHGLETFGIKVGDNLTK